MTDPTTETNSIAAPNQTIVGGPGDPGPMSVAGGAPSTSPQQEPQPAVSPAAPKTIYIGDMVFSGSNADQEALKYANELAYKNKQQAPAAVAQRDAQIDPADILFEDPKAAVRLIKEQAKNEFNAANSAKDAERDIWAKFYKNHPDLVGLEDIVDSQQRKHWNDIADLPVERALQKVAHEARQCVSRIRGSAVQTEQLSSKPAMVAGVTGATPPAVQMSQSRPTTFVEELAAAKAARRKTK